MGGGSILLPVVATGPAVQGGRWGVRQRLFLTPVLEVLGLAVFNDHLGGKEGRNVLV
jgi:hypothetical protein